MTKQVIYPNARPAGPQSRHNEERNALFRARDPNFERRKPRQARGYPHLQPFMAKKAQ